MGQLGLRTGLFLGLGFGFCFGFMGRWPRPIILVPLGGGGLGPLRTRPPGRGGADPDGIPPPPPTLAVAEPLPPDAFAWRDWMSEQPTTRHRVSC